MHFLAGKQETSDFLATKYGGFALKVRRFVPKKSDVFDPTYGCFLIFSRYFFSFCREIREIQRISAYTETEESATLDGKTTKFPSKSVLEGTRCLVKIFEGSELPLQAFESPNTGDSGRSVQYFLPLPLAVA